MHAYKLISHNQSKLRTHFYGGMLYMLEPNFIFYFEEHQSLNSNIRYHNYSITTSDFVYLGEVNERLPQSTRYSFREHPDVDSEIYNHVQQHGILVDVVRNQTQYSHIVRTMGDGQIIGEQQTIHFNISNMEPWVRDRWMRSFQLGHNLRTNPGPFPQLHQIHTDELISRVDQIQESREEQMATESEWTESRIRTIYMKDYLAEQIRSRYAFLDRPTSGLSNVVIDSFFPRLMYKTKLDTDRITAEYARTLPSTSVAISPFVASLLNVKQIETEQLCRILGYDKRRLKTLMNAVKTKQFKFVFVGTGGTGINTAHWLAEISKMVNVVGLFNEVHVYESDDIEISNLLRFPKDITSIKYDRTLMRDSKMQIISSDVHRLSKLTPNFHNHYIADEEDFQTGSYPYEIFNNTWATDDNGDTITNPRQHDRTTKPKVILYGAPDITTRKNLSKCGSFISATHAATNCYMYLNPKQDSDLQIETYGMIQLAPFFMNQLKMAITLLEILGRDDLDLTEQDIELLNYQFTGVNEMTTDRQYNWQYSPESLMLTEEESENV